MFLKLLVDWLELMEGCINCLGKLCIGYFVQYQVDELELDEMLLVYVCCLCLNEVLFWLWVWLVGFGLMEVQVEIRVGQFLGGQKVWLFLLLVIIDVLYLLIFDELMNYFDIESCEVLIEVLNDYIGVVVLVSYDMYLLLLVVDWLWLVDQGVVELWQGDLDDYCWMLLSGDEKFVVKLEKLVVKKFLCDQIFELWVDVCCVEECIEKLIEMLKKLDVIMVDLDIYDDFDCVCVYGCKYVEVIEVMGCVESLWMVVLEKLDVVECV